MNTLGSEANELEIECLFIFVLFWFSECATLATSSVDILEELAPLRRNLSGVTVAPGPYSVAPALYFTGELALSST